MSSRKNTDHLPLPFTIENVPREELKRLQDLGFRNYTELVRTIPSHVNLRPTFAHLADSYYNFVFRPDDVVLSTFPKSGTTWASEVLWAMKNIDNLQEAEKLPIDSRMYFLDGDYLMPVPNNEENPRVKRFREVCPEGIIENGITLQMAAAHNGPRFVKTHLQLDLLNPDLLDTCKVVYVARNPKDVCVSFFHHCAKSTNKIFDGTFSDFAEGFMSNGLLCGPYWDHVQQAWLRRDHKNLHFMFYEDMKEDVLGELRKLAGFLGVGLSDEEIQRVAHHASFGEMKSRESKLTEENGPLYNIPEFFRKGQTGDWKNIASEELNQRMDEWIADGSRGLNIPFKFE